MKRFWRVLVTATYHTRFSSSLWLFSKLNRPMSVSSTTLSASPPLLWWMVEIDIRGLPENFSPLRRHDRKYSRSSGAIPRRIVIQSNSAAASGNPISTILYFSRRSNFGLEGKNLTKFFTSWRVRASPVLSFSQLIIARVSSDSKEFLPLYEYE